MNARITTAALLDRLERIVDLRVHELEIHEYGNLDFRARGSEQNLIIHRGPRSSFDDALAFCQRSLSNYYDVNGDHRFAFRDEILAFARCLQPAGCAVEEFSRWFRERAAGLRAPIDSRPRGRGLAAWVLLDTWSEQLRVCETEREYLAVYWSTSA